MLLIKELDVVRLKDGRKATILEKFNDSAFYVEVSDSSGKAVDLLNVEAKDIDEVIFTA